MNTQEFKAWFAGYAEGKETLTAEQFARVCAEVRELSAGSTLPFPGYPQYPGVPGLWPPSVVTQTPATVSDWIVWPACDPIPLPLSGTTARNC